MQSPNNTIIHQMYQVSKLFVTFDTIEHQNCQKTKIDLEIIFRPKVDTLPFCAPIMGISVVI